MGFCVNGCDLISIVMPAYNSEKYIRDSIDSVLNQTYKKWELLVIDDGSVDNPAVIVEDFAVKDLRIKLIKNEKNCGVAASRNNGISKAQGDWIAFLDSDDLWDKQKLEKQMKCAYEASGEFIFTGSAYINEEGKYYKGIFQVPYEITYKKLRKHNKISCSSVLIRKHFFDTVKMERDDIHEDYAVWLKILKKGTIAYGVNEPLLTYRISKNSKSGNKKKTVLKTYKVFRFVGINPIEAAFFTVTHIFWATRKYLNIFYSHQKREFI